MKLPWSSSKSSIEQTQTSAPETKMPDSKSSEPILSFDGKRYDLQSLPDESKELIRRMQVADQQLRMHEDTLKVLAVGRQTIGGQLKEKLSGVKPLPDEKK